MAKYSYQRISTTTKNDKQSMLRQEKFAKDNDIPKSNWFQEEASGAKKDRPKLKQLLSVLKESDELYVIDASRLTRSLSQLLEILDFCKNKKIKLIMGDFVLDCTGELSVLTQGQIMMLGMINEINRLMIVESVREGVAAAREQGRIGGQPKLTKERIYKKNPEFFKYYAQFKNGQINMVELARLSCICRNTCISWCKIIEKK
jgi:DNA invertase Pin-like site-specific DNA recombinase